MCMLDDHFEHLTDQNGARESGVVGATHSFFIERRVFFSTCNECFLGSRQARHNLYQLALTSKADGTYLIHVDKTRPASRDRSMSVNGENAPESSPSLF